MLLLLFNIYTLNQQGNLVHRNVAAVLMCRQLVQSTFYGPGQRLLLARKWGNFELADVPAFLLLLMADDLEPLNLIFAASIFEFLPKHIAEMVATPSPEAMQFLS
jgi:hypothetical protein